jgi:hypothetical protein
MAIYNSSTNGKWVADNSLPTSFSPDDIININHTIKIDDGLGNIYIPAGAILNISSGGKVEVADDGGKINPDGGDIVIAVGGTYDCNETDNMYVDYGHVYLHGTFEGGTLVVGTATGDTNAQVHVYEGCQCSALRTEYATLVFEEDVTSSQLNLQINGGIFSGTGRLILNSSVSIDDSQSDVQIDCTVVIRTDNVSMAFLSTDLSLWTGTIYSDYPFAEDLTLTVGGCNWRWKDPNYPAEAKVKLNEPYGVTGQTRTGLLESTDPGEANVKTGTAYKIESVSKTGSMPAGGASNPRFRGFRP